MPSKAQRTFEKTLDSAHDQYDDETSDQGVKTTLMAPSCFFWKVS